MKSAGARWVRTAASGQFFTRWSWVLTFPFAITVMGGYDQAQSMNDRLIGVTVACGVHLLLGMLGLIAAAGERAASSPRLRIVIVVGALTALAVGRPFLLIGGANLWGVSLFSGPLAARVITNLIVVAAALSIIAMITTALATHKVVTARLRATISALEDQGSRDLADVTALSAAILQSAREIIVTAIPSAALRPLDPEHAAALLRKFADQAVRPLSHRLFDEAAIPATPPPAVAVPQTPAVLGWKDRRDIPGLIRPAPIWLTAAAYALLWTPYLLFRVPIGTALILVVIAVLVAAAANRAVQWGFGGARGETRLIVLFGSYAVVGAAIGATGGWVLASAGVLDGLIAVIFSVVIYPAFACLIAAGEAGFERLAGIEVQLQQAAAQAAARVGAAHNRLVTARRQVARFLHGDVQAHCVAAAHALKAGGPVTESDWAGILRQIELILEQSPTGARNSDARQTVAAVLQAWQYGTDVTLTADDRAWERLDADPAHLELVIDALAEGLTNAIRHSDGTEVQIAIRAVELLDAEPGVEVTVTSRGVLDSPTSGRGYGITQLAARARDVSLTQEGTTVRLRVEIA